MSSRARGRVTDCTPAQARTSRKVRAAKDHAHYSPRLLAKREAQAMVRNAAALVEAAERL